MFRQRCRFSNSVYWTILDPDLFMDVINDLGSDLAVALVMNGGFRDRLARSEIVELIGRIQTSLESLTESVHLEEELYSHSSVHQTSH